MARVIELTLGQRLRKIRDAKLWPQSKVAGAVKKSTSYVCQLERGRAGKASLDLLHLLADALEVPRNAVLTSEHDAALNDDAEVFVIRHSLEAFLHGNKRVDEEDATALRACLQKLKTGPRDIDSWTATFAYALALVASRLRKPGPKASTHSGAASRRPGQFA